MSAAGRTSTICVLLGLLAAGPGADNALDNGDFTDGTERWLLFTDASHQFLVLEGEARVRVLAPGANVQLYQRDVIVEGGTHYRLRFDARNTLGDDVRVQLVMDTPPAGSHGLDEVFDLTPEMQTFETIFVTTPEYTLTDARFRFRIDPFDVAGSFYYFDNVVLEADRDADGIPDATDNCPAGANPDQLDADGDGHGPPCDCDDSNGAARPGGFETCNGADDDCDGCIDEVLGGCVYSGAVRTLFNFGRGVVGDPRGITVDPGTGRIYVVDGNADRIEVFDATGSHLFGFGASGAGPGSFERPNDVTFDSLGRLLVTDVNDGRVEVFDAAGTWLTSIGQPGSADGRFTFPSGIDVDSTGRIFVTDLLDRLQAFAPDGAFLFSVGVFGSGPGQVRSPTALAVDAQDRVHVMESGNDRVQVFDRDGHSLFTYAERGVAPGQLNDPSGIAADAAGRTWVADSSTDRVQVFDSQGRVLAVLRGTAIEPTPVLQPWHPHVYGGRAYIADHFSREIRVLDVRADADGDGFEADPICPTASGDCDDTDPAVHPGADQRCDGVNNDCDDPTWPAALPGDVDADADGVPTCAGDCDDARPATYPGAPQVCDGFHNDCDAPDWPAVPADEQDLDGDGAPACGDCDDSDPTFFPAAPERCDGRDNDCDGCRDEGLAGCPGAGALALELERAGFGDGLGEFDTPFGVTVDVAAGRILVADTFNDRIQVLDLSGIPLFAFGETGGLPGQFRAPTRIRVNAAGQWVVADRDSGRIQVFEPDGSPAFGFRESLTAPSGLAIDAAGRILVSDLGRDRLHVFDAAGTELEIVGGPGTADGRFQNPQDVSVGPDGRIFVADTGNARIQVFDPGLGHLFSFGEPGAGDGQFSVPRGVLVDDHGRIWVADSGNVRFQVFDGAGKHLATLPLPAGPDGIDLVGGLLYGAYPSADAVRAYRIAIDADGDGHATDAACNDASNDCDDGNATVYPGAPQLCDGIPNDCADPDYPEAPDEADDDGDTFRTCEGDCDDGDPAVFPGAPEICDLANNDCDAPDWPAVPPGGIDADGDGVPVCAGDCRDDDPTVHPAALEACDRRDNDCDGCRDEGLSGCPGSGGLAAVSFPAGPLGAAPTAVAVDPVSGRVLVADGPNDRVRVFESDGTPAFDFGAPGTGPAMFDGPAGIAVDGLGRIVVTDRFNNRFQVFDASGGFQYAFGGSATHPTLLLEPTGVAIDAANRIVVADTGHHAVKIFDGPNLVATLGGFGTGAGRFDGPEGVVVDAAGRIWVADTGNSRLQLFGATGQHLLTLREAGPPPTTFNAPRGIAIGAHDRLWVADTINGRLRVLTTDGAHLVDTPLSLLPGGIALTATRLFVTGFGAPALRTFEVEGDRDGDGFVADFVCGGPGDCDDDSAATFPGASEVCDGAANDCLAVDWPVPPPGEADADGDGYRACGGDCEDADPAVNPGAAEVCNGLDDDCDLVADEDELGFDTDEDTFPNACDNCPVRFNPDQLDADGDALGDPCDNCPEAFNPDQSDVDRDGPGDDCDNCPVHRNAAQSDFDGDGTGDPCDLDDGRIHLQPWDDSLVEWQDEQGFATWNAYRGDLAVLRSGGDWTQAPGSNPLAARACGLRFSQHVWTELPAEGEAMFFLVTGVGAAGESGLGSFTAGERPNANPCP